MIFKVKLFIYQSVYRIPYTPCNAFSSHYMSINVIKISVKPPFSIVNLPMFKYEYPQPEPSPFHRIQQPHLRHLRDVGYVLRAAGVVLAMYKVPPRR